MTLAGVAVMAGVAFLGMVAVFLPEILFKISLKLSGNRSPEPGRRGIQVVRICGAVVAVVALFLIFADRVAR
ncbi:DUF6199 family natural product biosynthesis protein [Streptomyces sp. NPDC093991]|uniref:DUF6199 family natural product biosynthesis protein n=1 Tax=unclassified Streptomyces TaxID=2593676 RepID=UPI0034490750